MLRSSRKPDHIKCVLEKITYPSWHVSIVWNLESQVVELARRPRAMLKILYFGGGYQFFPISLGIKSFYDRGRKLMHLLIVGGVIIWYRGGNFSKFIDPGSHRGASHRGTWTGCSYVICSCSKTFKLT